MLPSISDLDLEYREIPSLARVWEGWREAANRALNDTAEGTFPGERKKTILLDCFTILKQTYDIISCIIPCNEIDLYLAERQSATPHTNPYAPTVVSFGKTKSSLKPFWGLFSRKDETCFRIAKGDGNTFILTPKQVSFYVDPYKLIWNRDIPYRLFNFLLLNQRLAHQDLEALNRIARSQNIPARFTLAARRLLDIAVREFSIFALEERRYTNPVSYSGAYGMIPTMPRGYTGYSDSGISGVSGYSPSGRLGNSGVSGGLRPSGFARNESIPPPSHLESGMIPRALAEGVAGADIPEEEKRKDQDKWDLI